MKFKPLKHHIPQLLQFSLLVIIASFFCFNNLSSDPLERWDEHTNYEVVQTQSFVPLMQGDNLFFEKPPLWYWLTMLSTEIFGLNNFSIRFISAISGFLVIILTFFIGKKYFSFKTGLIAGFVLLTTPHLFLKNSHIFSTHTFRSADLDSLQILFSLAVSFCLIKSNFSRKKYFWMILSGIFTGLGFLTKGPFALLPFVIYILLAITTKPFNHSAIRPFLQKFFIFIFSFLTCILPWHIYMVLKYGNDFSDTYFGYHIFQRSLSPIEEHNESIFFYIKLLFRKDFFLFGEIFIISIIFLIKNHFFKNTIYKIQYTSTCTQKYTLVFCISALLLHLTIISLAQTKLSWYLLPVYPFAALIIGKFITDMVKTIVVPFLKSTVKRM